MKRFFNYSLIAIFFYLGANCYGQNTANHNNAPSNATDSDSISILKKRIEKLNSTIKKLDETIKQKDSVIDQLRQQVEDLSTNKLSNNVGNVMSEAKNADEKNKVTSTNTEKDNTVYPEEKFSTKFTVFASIIVLGIGFVLGMYYKNILSSKKGKPIGGKYDDKDTPNKNIKPPQDHMEQPEDSIIKKYGENILSQLNDMDFFLKELGRQLTQCINTCISEKSNDTVPSPDGTITKFATIGGDGVLYEQRDRLTGLGFSLFVNNGNIATFDVDEDSMRDISSTNQTLLMVAEVRGSGEFHHSDRGTAKREYDNKWRVTKKLIVYFQ